MNKRGEREEGFVEVKTDWRKEEEYESGEEEGNVAGVDREGGKVKSAWKRMKRGKENR